MNKLLFNQKASDTQEKRCDPISWIVVPENDYLSEFGVSICVIKIRKIYNVSQKNVLTLSGMMKKLYLRT